MSNDFDLFGSSETDNLQEELAKNTYEWINGLSWVLLGILVFTGGASSGIWYAAKQSESSASQVNFAAQKAGQKQDDEDKSDSSKSGNKGSRQEATETKGQNMVGTIKKIEGGTLEIETPKGSSIKILSSGDTKVISTSADTFASLKIGDTISIVGVPEADGSINSTVITKGELPTLGSQGVKGGEPTNPSTKPGKGGGKDVSGGGGKGGGATSNQSGGQAGEGSANSTSQTSSGDGAKPGKGGGGGGALSNPDFIACLDKKGVVIKEGERPNMEDPTVATAMQECRSVVPQRKGGGQGGSAGAAN